MRPAQEQRRGAGDGRGVRGGAKGGRRGAAARVIGAGAFVLRLLRAEAHSIVVDPVRRLLRRGPAGLLLAGVAVGGVIFFHALAQRPAGADFVRAVGGVQGDLPLWLTLLRTPVSLYVPALDLPVWAGITQLFLAFALAENSLGRARTLVVAYATTLAGTLTARVMIMAGPDRWGFGLPQEAGRVLDTGPSAAVVGLFTYISVIRRAPVVFTLTGGSMVWESMAKPNLAGREHLIAVAAAVVLGLLHGRRPAWLPDWRRLRRPTPTSAPSAPSVPSGPSVPSVTATSHSAQAPASPTRTTPVTAATSTATGAADTAEEPSSRAGAQVGADI
ncbi:hypothetical protein ABZY42_26190 [Streptomyces sp. NPDC006622]|uniref:hypothetical protein n=1 Tax=Streptomyces sp. NPDC006622 TaxID=3155459 RepID=UPI0033A25888